MSLLLGILLNLGLAHAGTVTLDGSYGTSGALSGPHYQITASMGREMGNNLFQSFGTFDLSNGDSATFSGPANIQNILARVTGGSPSSIDGTINSSIIGANLFLLNPAGVMFGAHAQVNVSGSFAVSTANYLKFSDGGIFYAQLGANDVLSSAPVSAFGFLTPTPQPITFSGTSLNMPEGTGLHVVAGDVTLDGANLYAPGGNLTIFSAASAGEVPFSLASPGTGFASATNTSFGNITMKNVSSVAIDSTSGGGSIVIRGGKMVVDNSTVSSANSSSNLGGNISVQADQLSLSNGGAVLTSTSGSGGAGTINVKANAVSIDGGFIDSYGGFEDSRISSSSNGGYSYAGPAGAVNLTLTTGVGTLSLTNGGGIATETDYGRPGGTITVRANAVSIDGGYFKSYDSSSYSYLSSQISSSSFGTNSNVVPAGDLNLILTTGVGTLSLTNGGAITTTAENGGTITVHANAISIDGGLVDSTFGFVTSSQISSSPWSDGSDAGTAGIINLNLTTGVGTLSLTNGGIISTSVVNGGTITVRANSVSIDGGFVDSLGSAYLSQISTQSGELPAGDVYLILTTGAGTLSLTDGGEINTSTWYNGAAGTITVRADSVSIDGGFGDSSGDFNPSQISSEAYGGEGNGSAGAVKLTLTTGIGTLSLTHGGKIITDTLGDGAGGTISVKANAVNIDGGFVDSYGGFTPSEISSSSSSYSNNVGSGGAGNAGAVNLNLITGVGTLSLTNGGIISTSTDTSGAGGTTTVIANAVSIDGGFVDSYGEFTPSEISSSSSSAESNAGPAGAVNLTLTTGVGSLSVVKGGEIITNTDGSGVGGTTSVKANSVSIDGGFVDSSGYFIASQISSSAYSFGFVSNVGSAGAVNVTATTGACILSLTNGAEITSQSTGTGSGGSVTIFTGTASLNNSSTITASSSISDAGTIQLTASNLTLSGNSTITTSAPLGNGGNIQLHVGGMVYALDSEITASAKGTGGNITIDPEFVVLNNSPVSAFGGINNGNIVIDTDYFLASDSPVSATGALLISVPDLDLSGSLIALPNVLESHEKRLQESCARSINHEFSSLIVVGRGGTESSPQEFQSDFGMRFAQ